MNRKALLRILENEAEKNERGDTTESTSGAALAHSTNMENTMTRRQYKHGFGPRCSRCGGVGHYANAKGCPLRTGDAVLVTDRPAPNVGISDVAPAPAANDNAASAPKKKVA